MVFFILSLILFIFPCGNVFAADDKSFTDVIGSLLGVGMTVHDIIQAVCIIAGISLLLGSIVQYKKYRQNPIQTKLSTVIMNLIIGIALLILAFIPPTFYGR